VKEPTYSPSDIPAAHDGVQGSEGKPRRVRKRLEGPPPNRAHRLNLKFLLKVIRLARPYWFSDEKKKARWLLIGLLLLLVGYTEFAVLFNQQSGEFTSALAARDAHRFWRSIAIFFALLVVGVPIDAYYYYVRDNLSLNWRRWLTQHFLSRYLRDHHYYELLSRTEIDNPDQRISDDIYSFTNQSLSFILTFANGLFQLIAFSGVLWSISTSLVMFLCLYAVIVTLITFRVFGEKMVSLHFIQRRREADFRFGLVRIRENAEAIAFYQGEREEKSHLQQVFGRLFENGVQIIRWSLRLNFFYYTNSTIAMVLPTLIIAPRVLSGELEVGRIVQATGAFSAILASLTILVDNLDDLSRFAASVNRLETFGHSLAGGPNSAPEVKRSKFGFFRIRRKASPVEQKIAASQIQIRESEDLSFENVTLKTPDGERTLIQDLTCSVQPGEGLMIVGPSGLGKSSLLRSLAGLWTTGEGTILRPKIEDMLFLPQQPYVPYGSLRAQLSYPDLGRALSDEEIREVLAFVNLPGLIERCGNVDAEFNFDKILSVGERQRLAFARVLLKQPRYVLLDEASSALDRENEAAVYERLRQTGVTLVSVSHHPALVKYHSHVLELKPESEWSLHSADKFRLTADLV
jgi:putative ATP-binding cassette transporter